MPSSRPSRRAFGLAALGTALVGCGPVEPSARAGAVPSPASRRVVVDGREHLVPARPTRVVALGSAALTACLDVAGPVVATSGFAMATVPPALREVARAVPVLGRGRLRDATVDAVTSVGPDLVVAADDTPAEHLSALAARLPLVVVRRLVSDRRRRTEEMSALLRGTPAARLERALAAHAERIRSRTGPLSGRRIVVLRAWDPVHITAYGPGSPVGDLYAAAGARFVPQVLRAPSGQVQAALADVGSFLVDAEIVMLAGDYSGGLDAFTGGSLAGSMPVADHVRRTGAVLAAAGPLAIATCAQAHHLLDSLDVALATPPRS